MFPLNLIVPLFYFGSVGRLNIKWEEKEKDEGVGMEKKEEKEKEQKWKEDDVDKARNGWKDDKNRNFSFSSQKNLHEVGYILNSGFLSSLFHLIRRSLDKFIRKYVMTPSFDELSPLSIMSLISPTALARAGG
jgi:hypothetical protein